MKMLLMNPKDTQNTLTEIEVNDTDISARLQDFYDHIECGTIDMVSTKFGGKHFEVICDDEGLFKDEIIPSITECDGKVRIVGKIILCHTDGYGNDTPIEQGDMEHLKDYLWEAVYNGNEIRVLMEDNYD